MVQHLKTKLRLALFGFVMSVSPLSSYAQDTEKAVFAGGCFWCIASLFDDFKGIQKVTSGYTGGSTKDPNYKQVSSGKTKHIEAVEVYFDPKKIKYEKLVNRFLRNIDPTDAGGQFADRGHHYTTAIFYTSDNQKKLAEKALKELGETGKFSKPIVVKVKPAKAFYRAEEYHQDFHKKNKDYYERYKRGSGRAGFIERTWGKDSK